MFNEFQKLDIVGELLRILFEADYEILKIISLLEQSRNFKFFV